MEWPQITVIVLMALNTGIALAKHGEQKLIPNYNILESLFDSTIVLALLVFGGFFSS